MLRACSIQNEIIGGRQNLFAEFWLSDGREQITES